MIVRNNSLMFKLLMRLPLWLPVLITPARVGNRMDLISEVRIQR